MHREHDKRRYGQPVLALLTADEVAQLLKVERSWVYDAARRGAIPHVRLGRYVRFHRESIETWLRARDRGPIATDTNRAS